MFAAAWLLASIVGSIAIAPVSAPSWQPWVHLSGVFDVAGPRSDGRLVANANDGLVLLSPDGTMTAFARGSGGYSGPAGAEAYIDVSPGMHVSGANCNFAANDVFILRPGGAIGITRVDNNGHSTNFLNVTGIDSLNGIAFDRTGRFDHRLLITGPHQGRMQVIAIDCTGRSQHITDSAPIVEGGLAVAPPAFGAYAGDLIAPDELSGSVWAIEPTGKATLVVASGIKYGQDVGVESEGFVPAGFSAGGWAYVADRATAGSPHPGTDMVLRLSSDQLKAAGARDGDLLIAAEGGAVTVDVRCTTSCVARTVVPTETTAHGEGRLLMVAGPPSSTPTPSSSPQASATAAPTRSSFPGTPWLVPLLILVLAAAVAIGALAVRLARP